MVEVASLDATVNVDTSKVNPELAQVKASFQKLESEFKKLTADNTKLNAEVTKLTSNLKQKKRAMDEASGSTANLGRFMREFTTSILGTNVATIALGTALGNVLTQAVSRVVLAVATAATAVQRIINELVTLSNVTIRAAQSFDLIVEAADTSKKSLDELAASYTNIARQAQGTRVSIEEVNRIFRDYEANLSRLQGDTIVGSFGKATDALGDFIGRLGGLISAGSAVTFLLNGIRRGIEFLANLLPKTTSSVAEFNAVLDDLKARQIRLQDEIVFLAKLEDRNARVIEHMAEARKQLTINLEDQVRIRKQLADIEEQGLSPEQQVARLNIVKSTTAEFQDQIRIGDLSNEQQARSLQLIQLSNQLRSTGREISRKELEDFAELIIKADAARQFQTIRESLISTITLEEESHKRRIENLSIFLQTKKDMLTQNLINEQITSQEFNASALELDRQQNQLREAENTRHWIAIRTIQMQQLQIGVNATIAAAQSISTVLQLAGQKNKAAAIASLAINTAIAVAQAFMANEAAAMQALAVPPAPNWGYYGFVKAMGAVQIAGIIAAGALQIGGAAKGGGARGGGGTTTPQATPVTPTEMEEDFGRAVTIQIEPGQVYTTEQVRRLMERMNEETKNGAKLITTEIRPM